MKPITNVLLIATIVCYVFLPFYTVTIQGHCTGLEYTADTISNTATYFKKIFAMLPFIACFGGIAFNCMKNRFWGIAVSAWIALGIYFFDVARNYTKIHDSLIVNITDQGVGFTITGIANGYYISYTLLILALISAIVSVLPFKFNRLHELAEKGSKYTHELAEKASKHTPHLHHKEKQEEEK